MSVFYFNRETGRRVSKSTWKRSHAQGGTKYVRRSSKGSAEGASTKPTGENSPRGEVPGKTGPGYGASSSAPLTWEQYRDRMKELERKARKKQLDSLDDFDNGIEYETGVDY